ncbi:MAG: nicotinate-nucleotide adenylyltransferase [Gammaproteobacteria bacterium]|nr:nicotinate-nucleotide adenylyltransferase [Gammaproteobacteria bacterium]
MTRPVGIFGGTFDPVHFGHLRPALELQESLELEEVRMLPCSIPPHREAPLASSEQRLAMLQLAIDEQPGLVIDERELHRPGPSYMVDTLASIREELGDTSLCLLLGMDAFIGLEHWHQWQRLIELAHIVVAHRPGWDLQAEQASAVMKLWQSHGLSSRAELAQQAAGGVWLQPVSQLEISATDIREHVRQGKSLRYLMPDAVWQFIEDEGLYLD